MPVLSPMKIQEIILIIFTILYGPGFSLDKIRDSGFYEIDDRIYTFVPQSSIFGMIFEHEESYTIVKSNQKGFLQHDIYSWEIEQNSLIRLKSTTNFSVFFDHTLKEFVESLTIAQRREFTKEVFCPFVADRNLNL